MILNILYVLFILSCLFDNANNIVGVKLPLFVVICFYTLLLNNKPILPSFVIRYIVVFALLLPIWSILWGKVSNGHSYMDESFLDIIKPYLFIFMSLCIINSPKLDICKIFSYCLLLMAAVIILIFLLYLGGIVPFELLYGLGNGYGVFTLGERNFGGLTIERVYFHTSPMLIFGSFYFLNQYFKESSNKALFYSIFISFSLFISGSRNDMIMAFMPYLTFGYLKSSPRIRFLLLLMAVFLVLIYFVEISALFDLDESSNSDKLGYLPTYLRYFSDSATFFMGDGLGSYAYFPSEGYVNNTELTYFELLRRFGLFGALIYIYLMFKPVVLLYKKPSFRWLAFALLMYLIMIFSNPFFFSSNGMLILSIVLYSIYLSKKTTNIISYGY